MVRNRLTRAESKAQTRNELLAAARELFLRDGYHATTLEQVAELAGYTKGAVYSSFKNKAELFLAVFEETFVEPQLVDFRALFADNKTVDEQVHLLAGRKFDPQTGQWFLPTIEFFAHAARDPDLLAEYARCWRRLRSGLAELMRQQQPHAADNGALPAEQRAVATLALATGVALERLIDADGIPDDLLARAYRALNQPVDTTNDHDDRTS